MAARKCPLASFFMLNRGLSNRTTSLSSNTSAWRPKPLALLTIPERLADEGRAIRDNGRARRHVVTGDASRVTAGSKILSAGASAGRSGHRRRPTDHDIRNDCHHSSRDRRADHQGGSNIWLAREAAGEPAIEPIEIQLSQVQRRRPIRVPVGANLLPQSCSVIKLPQPGRINAVRFESGGATI